jgi:hypothetical protein
VWHASALGDSEIVQALLSHNGNPTTADSKRSTPLMISLINRHIHITELLLDILKADSLEARDLDGTTALMIAAGLGDSEVVSKLLKRGCDPMAMNADGHTALYFAYHGRSQLVYFLSQRGTKKSTEEVKQRVTKEIQRYSHLIQELTRGDSSHQVDDHFFLPTTFPHRTLSPSPALTGSQGSYCERFRSQTSLVVVVGLRRDNQVRSLSSSPK